MELHQERFEAWLFSQPKDRIIEAANGIKCFLCSFVKETTHFKKVHFPSWDRWSDGVTEIKPLPHWARNLIDPLWCSRFANFAISAGEMQDRYRKLFPETITTHEKTRNELPASNTPPQDRQDPGTGQADGTGSVLAEMGADH